MRTQERRAFIIGLGPVGLATAWSLLKRNIQCVGYDTLESVNRDCRDLLFSKTPELQPDLAEYTRAGKLQFSKDLTPATNDSVVVCVGTPFDENKKAHNIHFLIEALEHLKASYKNTTPLHLIVRSTIVPGTMDDLLLKGSFECFRISYWPEFLREKCLVEDLTQPPLCVVAHQDDWARQQFANLIDEQFNELTFKEAEALKLSSNAFHALKVAFANEVGRWGKQLGFDADKVMKCFNQDTKLNISKRYLTPGKAFAGACLEKDLQALYGHFQLNNLQLPVIEGILDSNKIQKVQDDTK